MNHGPDSRASTAYPCAPFPSVSMDSLLANYASDDEDDNERGGVGREEKAAAESLQLPPSKPPSSSSPLLSSSLPPPKSSAALSSSLFSTLPPPKSLASAPSPAPTIPSRPAPSHLGEVDGDNERSGILTIGTPSSTAFKAQSSLFSSLPPPKPSSFSSGPTSSQLEGERSDDEEEEDKAGIFTTYATPSNPFSAQKSMFSSIPLPKDSSTPSFFSSVPPPKFEQPNSLNIANPPSSDRNPKKVVQFKLPLNPSLLKNDDSDDDEDNVTMRKRSVKDSSSNIPNASSSLFSILPAPKSTLGLVPSSATASSRRSVIDADVSASNTRRFTAAQESGTYGESGGDECYSGGWVDAPTEIGAEDVKAPGFEDGSAGGWDLPGVEETTYPGYDGSNAATYWDPSYGGAIDYGSYEGNWSETAAAVNSDVPDLGRIAGKRGRNEIPTELMEVHQDELMKNRPRQDQSRLTGIAFGPSHQPASSAKGKPTKLHKRKHQIGSLYFDMKQKEMELAERRSRGLLTKSETQAKYGW